LLAFDIGTTYSGISFAVLDPGQVPEIKPVTRCVAFLFLHVETGLGLENGSEAVLTGIGWVS